MAAAHVFVADLSCPLLGDEDRHHLERVLRLRAGESVTASDGCGGWRLCEYRPGGSLEPVGPISSVPRLSPAVTVAFALVKGDRPEWTVQKLVEAGVDRIIPMTTGRSVVRWSPEKAAREVDRLRAVARGAAMQSRQVWLPEVASVADFASLAGAGGGGADAGGGGAGVGGLSAGGEAGAGGGAGSGGGAGGAGGVGDRGAAGVAMAQPGGAPPSLDRPTILVGPEGGWDESELLLGLPRVGLGPSVLRSETAAVAAGVLLCALRAGFVLAAE